MTTCLFCGVGESVPFSAEDVVPRWLLHHLDLPSHDQTLHVLAESKTGTILDQHVTSSFRFLEPRVCRAHCNNGWMSSLEESTIPILKPLIDETSSLEQLSVTDRRTLAKWAVKTAYMHAYAGKLDTRPDLAHLAALNTDVGTPVPGVIVCGTYGAFVKPSSFLQIGIWPQFSSFDVGPFPLPGSYKIAMQFRRLHLLVAYWPENDAEYLCGPTNVPVWPKELTAEWPGFKPNEAALISRFAAELAIWRG
jgi:hypothetical protein